MRGYYNAMRVELVERDGWMFLLYGFMTLYHFLRERCRETLVIGMVIELD